MFSWAKDFFRRHKRKFIALGVVAGGVYSSYKILEWKLTEWREKEREEYAKQAKKQYHYESNKKTSTSTFLQLMIPLRNKVFEVLDVEELTDMLKENPENKFELWEQLKLLSFARTLTAMISTSTLYVFLQIQTNIIAGYMYLENMESSPEIAEVADLVHNMEIYQPISNLQQEYLGNVRYLLENGVVLMTDTLKTLVTENIGSMSLKSKISHYELSKIIFNIWHQFKANGLWLLQQNEGGNSAKSPFSRYILNAEECQKKTKYLDEEKYQQLMLETFDVIDSEDFATVLSEGIQDCLETMLQSLEPHFQHDKITEIDRNDDNDDDFVSTEISLPLAKIIPIINAESNQIFKAGRNEYLHTLFSVESINSFSANVYESFSSQGDA